MHKLWANFLTSAKREKLMIVANVSAMTVTFLILGVFVMVVVGSQTILKTLENQAQLTVFFKDDFTEANIMQMKTALQQDGRVAAVNYVSKDDAYKIFTDMNKDEPILIESVTKNILPASLEIRAKKLADLSVLNDELVKKDGVEEVKFFRDVVEKFKQWSMVINAIGLVLTMLFLIISYSIVVVTLRLTIHSKGQELEVMKLVGASDKYVRSPLVFQGVFLGIVSALMSSVILFILTLLADLTNMIPANLSLRMFFVTIPGTSATPYIFTLILSLILFLSGSVLGYLGSISAIKKYLKY